MGAVLMSIRTVMAKIHALAFEHHAIMLETEDTQE
jgi:hypothetical protein